MRRIGVDARLYFQTGVGVYLRNLLYYLQKISPKELIFYIYVMNDEASRINFRNKNFIKKAVPYRWHTIGEQGGFADILYKEKLDLVHFTYFSYPIIYKRPFVATVHDLTPVLFKTGRASTKNPLLFGLKHSIFKNIVLAKQIKNARAIITPTETVKEQLVKLYGLEYKNKIFSIYEGINYEILHAKENTNLIKEIKDDFFLYVGNFYPHKNLERLIEAFAKVKTKMNLVLVGPDDFFAKRLVQMFKQLNMSKKIILYNNPKLKDFVFFYKNAKALVHPSLSEGFGLPLVEAAYFDLPIIASNIDVFKEILSGQYISFDPYNIEDIKEKIEFFIKEGSKFDYKSLLKKYSFEKMAKQTLEVYQKHL